MLDLRKTIGTKDNPLELKTPPGTASYTLHVDEKDRTDILVCTVGKTISQYDLRCIDDLTTKLKHHGDWMLSGSQDDPDGSMQYLTIRRPASIHDHPHTRNWSVKAPLDV